MTHDTTSNGSKDMVIGIDYGTPDGDRSCAMIHDRKTGEASEIPLSVAEYIQSLQQERDAWEKDARMMREAIDLLSRVNRNIANLEPTNALAKLNAEDCQKALSNTTCFYE